MLRIPRSWSSIADDVGCTERPACLVFETAAGTPVLRAVLDAEMGVVDARNPATGDGAPEAGGIGDQMRLAIGQPLLVHGFAGNLAGFLELHVAMATRRQGAQFADHVHQRLRANGRQALAGHRVFGQHFLAGSGCCHERRNVVDSRNLLRTANRHHLQVLRTHHRANAGTARRPVQSAST